jgi:hypothetical protein
VSSPATMLSEKPRSIAYFGASVTAQREGFRPLLHQRLRDRFGQDHDSIFAGIGGVNIVAATFLADEFVVRHDPDFCLVEFTSAHLSSWQDPADGGVAMDGLLAKLRSAGCRPWLLHLYRRDWDERQAELMAAFEAAADRHDVPSIDLVTPLRDQVEHGEEEALFRDDVHTTDAGSRLVAELTEAALASIQAERGGQPAHPPGVDYSGAHFVPVAAGECEGVAEMKLFRLHRPYLEVAAGSTIRPRIAGRLAGLALVVGPESGELEIADRAGSQRLMAWDEFCHYERFTAIAFERACPAGDEISIELTQTIPDYSRSREPVEPSERRTAKVIGYLVLPE